MGTYGRQLSSLLYPHKHETSALDNNYCCDNHSVPMRDSSRPLLGSLGYLLVTFLKFLTYLLLMLCLISLIYLRR